MKVNRTYLFIAVSSIALVTVLIIQVNWIFQTAKMKEELFNEKANIVLSKAAVALSSDTLTCKSPEIFCEGSQEARKIDSLFSYYMQLYNIHIDYYFEVKPGSQQRDIPFPINVDPYQEASYQTCVKEGATKNGLELKLVFPGKEQFILAEMGIPFITSVILILVVLVMSWRTVLSLMKEKKISEHTTDFLNNMTHEFKTPLTNIALAGKMMIKESTIKQEDKIKHYSGIILEENEKLRLQVEQVLSMTALERGEIPFQKTETDLHQLIHDALKCISIQIETKHGHVDLMLNAQRFVVMGDRTHLTNAVCNLIDNAIKYSGDKPELVIRTSSNDTHVNLFVTDKGIGIEEKYHKKVFDKFFRVPTGNRHDVKGFGLGLTYIKTIVELHEGTIGLESKTGEGTTFIITLPYV